MALFFGVAGGGFPLSIVGSLRPPPVVAGGYGRVWGLPARLGCPHRFRYHGRVCG